MDGQDDDQDQLDHIPTRIRDAHRHSIHHRSEIESSELCGCFYCRAQFPPSKIVEWVDDDSDSRGTTAICPHCGIDSVLGDRSGFPVSAEFLAEMHLYWFSA
jgi:hypothetical protein